jgi:putative phosphoesterase
VIEDGKFLQEGFSLSSVSSKLKRIGLLADSHGDLRATEKSIRTLRRRDVDLIVHLGDFSDSVRLDLLAAMIDILKSNQVLAVMGNNDFMVGNMLAEEAYMTYQDRDRMAAFIKDIPMKRVLEDICFAHSLPFDHFKACYEPIDNGSTVRADQLFQETDHRVLFCGHSHLPVLFRLRSERVTRENVPPGRPLSLDSSDRYIMVVGAVEEGECALFDRESSCYERIKLF